jgi:hypothetical protein
MLGYGDLSHTAYLHRPKQITYTLSHYQNKQNFLSLHQNKFMLLVLLR